MTIRMTLFDVDGTIWDAPIDWLAVRCELGLPVDGRLIYMHLMDLVPQEQTEARAPEEMRKRANLVVEHLALFLKDFTGRLAQQEVRT